MERIKKYFPAPAGIRPAIEIGCLCSRVATVNYGRTRALHTSEVEKKSHVLGLFLFFNWVLQPIKIISLILSQVNQKGRMKADLQGKPPGLPHIRIFNGCEVQIESSVTRVTVRHHEACRVMPNSYPK